MIPKNIRYVVTQNSDRRILENIGLRIEDDSISGIGRNLSTEVHEAIDCFGKFVLPDLVSANCHVSMTLLRGISDDLELDGWLHDVIFPS